MGLLTDVYCITLQGMNEPNTLLSLGLTNTDPSVSCDTTVPSCTEENLLWFDGSSFQSAFSTHFDSVIFPAGTSLGALQLSDFGVNGQPETFAAKSYCMETCPTMSGNMAMFGMCQCPSPPPPAGLFASYDWNPNTKVAFSGTIIA